MNNTKCTLVAALLATTTTSLVSAEETETRVSQTRPSQAMLSTGVFTFAASYVPAFVVATQSGHPGDHALYIPVAGPWMDLSERHCSTGQVCDREGLYEGLLIADGIFQALGALNMVGAFVFPETVTSTIKGETTTTRERASLRVAPIAGGTT